MSLKIGQQIKAKKTQKTLTVNQKLGEGSQGAVYSVQGDGGPFAVKWYHSLFATPEQHEHILDLIDHGPPEGSAGSRFVWPIDLVTAKDTERFGYIMALIDREQYFPLGEIFASPSRLSMNYEAICVASYQLTNSFRALHSRGHCYRDISRENLLFDPTTGNTLICDNDNIGIDRHSECGVLGTLEYMAPEVVRRDASPSTETDLHSLAVLLFILWNSHHPFHGKMRDRYRCWDLPAKRVVFGKDPVFIHNPKDVRNQLPESSDFKTARRRWRDCPASLRDLFLRAFDEGLRHPERRVTEGEWQHTFLQLKDGIIHCPKCEARNLWPAPDPTLSCWHCQTSVSLPPRMRFDYPRGPHWLLLTRSAKLLHRHFHPSSTREEETAETIGEIVQHPANPSVWGIKNLTSSPWFVKFEDGSTEQILPQKAAPLQVRLELSIIGGKVAGVVEG